MKRAAHSRSIRNGALGALLLGSATIAGCLGPAPTSAQPPTRALGGVTIVGPRCAKVRSCLLGRVVAAESYAPLARAAVFLQPDPEAGSNDPPPDDIVLMTDEQGVFTVVDAPAGHYVLSVYKGARRIKTSGLELGAPGTQVVPIRLAPPI